MFKAMKKAFFLLAAMSLTCVMATAQELLYDTASDGRIVAKAKFVDSFYSEERKDITPYTLTRQFEVRAGGKDYQVKGYRYKGWENDAGDFEVLQIEADGDTLLTLRNDDGFVDFSHYWGTFRQSTCDIEKLDGGAVALIFTTWIYESPNFVSVIVLNDKQAELVFNKRLVLNNVNIDGDGDITYTLMEDFIEPLEGGTFTNPPKHELKIYRGRMYFK